MCRHNELVMVLLIFVVVLMLLHTPWFWLVAAGLQLTLWAQFVTDYRNTCAAEERANSDEDA